MKIVFRLNYHTVPGQSLWLKLAAVCEVGGKRRELLVPMDWRNDQQWETSVDLPGDAAWRLEIVYQFRQEGHGVELDEWGGPRCVLADPAVQECLFLADTWCSAGTVDYAFETNAFKSVLPVRGPFAEPRLAMRDNHLFQLRMAAVPVERVPCLIGSVHALGAWDWAQALPMQEVAADVWQVEVDLPADGWLEYKYGMYDPELGRVVALEGGDNRVLDGHADAARQWTRISDENYRRDGADLLRAAGVAVPVFSLRSDRGLGVGEFADLKRLADWAGSVGLRMIQILPVNDTTAAHDWLDSYPYSAISVFALHPLYLCIDDLGYAMPAEFTADHASAREWLNALEHVDYVEVMKAKSGLTRRVFAHHAAAITESRGFQAFLTDNRGWVVPYAVFCLKRDHYGTADFNHWDEWAYYDPERVAALADSAHPAWPEISYHIWLQYELDRQLASAVCHLHRHGLALKGDLPIGIDRHSVEAWTAPHLFKMEAQSGAPPDAFAIKGQNWGFPTYDWQVMSQDGYAWWRLRFAQLSHYFDAYRVDHILGFFRIWQIPLDQMDGIMGWFDPALPLHLDEIRGRGIPFDFQRYCRPYIREDCLPERFGDTAPLARDGYLDDLGGGVYQLRGHVANQRLIVEHFAGLREDDLAACERMERLRDGLLDCASEVLFFEVPGSQGEWFHPRCSMQTTRSYRDLDAEVRGRMEDLYNDYFYQRQEAFWQACGLEKLPVMRRASPMLLCGEDLGMVPACVPGVLRELGILSLEIQRMPKRADHEFADPAQAPYLSVVSTSTHDMSTLRGWWREDARTTARFAWSMLGEAFPPTDLSGELAGRIIRQHLLSPAMWAVFPLQDLLAIDESIRHPDPDAERINVPAIRHYQWRYRLHLGVDELIAADDFNEQLARLLRDAGRARTHTTETS